MSISTFPWLKVLVGLVLMSMLLLVSSCFLPLGRSAENPSWFNQLALVSLGTAMSPYILPEMRELCTEYGPPVDDDFVVGGYAYSPFQFEKTIGEFEFSSEMIATVKVGCFPCIQELVIDGYPYIEAFYVSPKDLKRLEKISRFQGLSTVGGQYGYATETGWYRYRLVNRKAEPEQCRLYDFIATPVGYDPTRSLAELRAVRKAKWARKSIEARLQKRLDSQEKCVAVERISAPTSRYLVENFKIVQQEINPLIGEGLIIRTSSIITDRSIGKMLASQNEFSYWYKRNRQIRKSTSERNYAYLYVSYCGGRFGFLNTRKIVRP